ncbi:hypothetical protein HN011_011191, partial [Eciton burchellii]
HLKKIPPRAGVTVSTDPSSAAVLCQSAETTRRDTSRRGCTGDGGAARGTGDLYCGTAAKRGVERGSRGRPLRKALE